MAFPDSQTSLHADQQVSPRDHMELRILPFSYIHAAGLGTGKIDLAISPPGKWLLDLSESALRFAIATDDDAEFSLGTRKHQMEDLLFNSENATAVGEAADFTLIVDGVNDNDAILYTAVSNKDLRIEVLDTGVDEAFSISILGDLITIQLERISSVTTPITAAALVTAFNADVDMVGVATAALTVKDKDRSDPLANNDGSGLITALFMGGFTTTAGFAEGALFSLSLLDNARRFLKVDGGKLGASIFLQFNSPIDDGDTVNGWLAFKR